MNDEERISELQKEIIELEGSLRIIRDSQIPFSLPAFTALYDRILLLKIELAKLQRNVAIGIITLIKSN